MHSSEFYDCVDNDPCAHYFCTRLIKEDILESAALDMPNEASGESEHSQQASCRIQEETIAQPNEASTTNNPITKALSQLATVMMPIMSPSNESSNKKTQTPRA